MSEERRSDNVATRKAMNAQLMMVRDEAERVIDGYNPEFDLVPGGPRVMTSDYNLAQGLLMLLQYVDTQDVKIHALEEEKVAFEQRIDALEIRVEALAMLISPSMR